MSEELGVPRHTVWLQLGSEATRRMHFFTGCTWPRQTVLCPSPDSSRSTRPSWMPPAPLCRGPHDSLGGQKEAPSDFLAAFPTALGVRLGCSAWEWHWGNLPRGPRKAPGLLPPYP